MIYKSQSPCGYVFEVEITSNLSNKIICRPTQSYETFLLSYYKWKVLGGNFFVSAGRAREEKSETWLCGRGNLYVCPKNVDDKYSFSYIREKFRKNVFYLCNYETHFRFSLLNDNLLRNFILVQPYSDRQGIEGEQLNYIQRKTMQIRQKIKIKNLHQLDKILQGLRINHSEENNVVKILYIFNNKKVL